MLSKAALFRDHEAFVALLNPGLSPTKCKSLGRSVKRFDGDVWNRVVLTVAFEACYQKFGGKSGEDIKQVLLGTGDSLLVEASPKDRIWGVGLSERDASLQDPKLWRGCNILGWALMETRSRLKESVGVPKGPPTRQMAADAQPCSRCGSLDADHVDQLCPGACESSSSSSTEVSLTQSMTSSGQPAVSDARRKRKSSG